MAIEKHELHCHACNNYVQFDLDPEWRNGNYVIKCPNCAHEHCRVIKDGRVTDRRWDHRNSAQPATYLGATSSTVSISYTFVGKATGTFMSEAWANCTSMS